MQIQFFCPRWGAEAQPWDAFCARVKAAGYDGVEASIPFDEKEKAEIKEALQRHGLLLIGQYYQSFEPDFDEHAANYAKHLRNIASLQPVKIDAQTGKDYFSPGQNAKLFALAHRIESETGILICHETHRNKALFAAHVGKQLLTENPSLRITADFSHWCNVAESLLEDQQEAVALACSRAHHIHARVGHAQSAQVIDPRLLNYEPEWKAHLRWWDAIIEQRRNDTQTMTITPEAGPAPYLVHLPFTNMPIANQWDINVYIMQHLKTRYKN